MSHYRSFCVQIFGAIKSQVLAVMPSVGPLLAAGPKTLEGRWMLGSAGAAMLARQGPARAECLSSWPRPLHQSSLRLLSSLARLQLLLSVHRQLRLLQGPRAHLCSRGFGGQAPAAFRKLEGENLSVAMFSIVFCSQLLSLSPKKLKNFFVLCGYF